MSAETETEHFLVRAKIRLKIKRSEKGKKSGTHKWDIGKLYKKEVKEEFNKGGYSQRTKYSVRQTIQYR